MTKGARNRLFISYSHKDRKWLRDLKQHLRPLELAGAVTVCDDTQIRPGELWQEKIDAFLSTAKVVVLLVTPNFLASDFISNTEVPTILELARSRGLRVIWVAVGASMYRETGLNAYQAANNPYKPLADLSVPKRDAEWVKICEKIKSALEDAPDEEEAAQTQDAPRGEPRAGAWEASRRSETPPSQLPPDIADFTGRRALVGALLRLFRSRPEAEGTSPTVADIAGMAGVGKSTLAVHVAHLLKKEFPDGQLYINLRGADGQPVTPAAALAGFLRLTGAADKRAAMSVEDMAGLFRARLVGRRVLLLLDNARDEPQVRHLLPGSPGCAVIITSRKPLSAMPLDELLDLSVMTEGEARKLLERMLGGRRVRAEAEAAKKIISLCGLLPLALRIAGGTLKGRAHVPLQRYAEQLADERRRLELMQLSDLGVRASFTLSYSDMPPREASSFRALATLPGYNISPGAAAALLGVDELTATERLDRLVDVQLLEPAGGGRYRFHDLMRLFAHECLQREEEQPTRDALVERGVRFYADYVAAHESDYIALEPEAGNFSWALQTASERGMHDPLLKGVNAACRFLTARGLYRHAKEYLTLARQAADSLRDSAALAVTLQNLGAVEAHEGHYERAESYYEEALELARREHSSDLVSGLLDSLGGVASILGEYDRAEAYLREGHAHAGESNNPDKMIHLKLALGSAADTRGDYDQSETYYREGLKLARELPREKGQLERTSQLLGALGWAAAHKGDYRQAERYWQEALIPAREIKHRAQICYLLANVGWVAGRLGEYERAGGQLEEGLRLATEDGYLITASAVFLNLGVLSLHRGGYAEARDFLEQGLALEHLSHQMKNILLENLAIVAKEVGDYALAERYLREALFMHRSGAYPERSSALLTYLGEVLALRGDFEQAEKHLDEALALAREIRNLERVSVACNVMGEVATARGLHRQAEESLSESLRLAERIGYRWLVGRVLNAYGAYYLALNETERAASACRSALEIADEIGSRPQRGAALYCLARVAAARGDIAEASRLARACLDVFRLIGHQQAAVVERRLEDVRPGLARG